MDSRDFFSNMILYILRWWFGCTITSSARYLGSTTIFRRWLDPWGLSRSIPAGLFFFLIRIHITFVDVFFWDTFPLNIFSEESFFTRRGIVHNPQRLNAWYIYLLHLIFCVNVGKYTIQIHTVSVWEPEKHSRLYQETRFYREIIQMCRSKGYANPQAILKWLRTWRKRCRVLQDINETGRFCCTYWQRI